MNSTPALPRPVSVPPIRTFRAVYFHSLTGGIAGDVRETFVRSRDVRAAEYEVARVVGPGFNGIIELEEATEADRTKSAFWHELEPYPLYGKRVPFWAFWRRWNGWKFWQKKS